MTGEDDTDTGPDPSLSETGVRRHHQARRMRAIEPDRPLWQRYLMPMAGVVLVVAGLILWLTPVLPGGALAFVGLPLVFAFSGRYELWFRSRMRRVLRRVLQWFRRRFGDRPRR